jgi:hypothetical protein
VLKSLAIIPVDKKIQYTKYIKKYLKFFVSLVTKTLTLLMEGAIISIVRKEAMNMIYCGYQGCGKTTYCKAHPNTAVDLDSSNFKKCLGWESSYITQAKHLEEQNKTVFISAHKEVINYLYNHNYAFEILVPAENKEAWLKRLEFRYYKNPILPNLKAINDFKYNYDNDMLFYNELEKKGITVHRIQAKIITNIEECINK